MVVNFHWDENIQTHNNYDKCSGYVNVINNTKAAYFYTTEI